MVKKINGHSLRVGGAQEMLKHGAALPQVTAKGGLSKAATAIHHLEKSLVQSNNMGEALNQAHANVNDGASR